MRKSFSYPQGHPIRFRDAFSEDVTGARFCIKFALWPLVACTSCQEDTQEKSYILNAKIMDSILQLYLIRAIEKHWPGEVKLLITSGVEINFIDHLAGLSPLAYAQTLGSREDIVDILRQNGAREERAENWKLLRQKMVRELKRQQTHNKESHAS